MMDILNGDSLAAMARIVESDLIKVEVEEGEAVPLEENSVPTAGGKRRQNGR